MTRKKTPVISSERAENIYRLLIRSKLEASDLTIIKNNESQYLEILNEALTHTSKSLSINHERLEFHGDAVLRLAATEYIQANFPSLKVGERSALRAQLVSDEWLAKIGKRIGITESMLIAPKSLKDIAAKETICAEGTEALIGALYECLKSIESIHLWLKTYWDKESKEILADPYKQNAKSALQEWSQSQGFNQPIYEVEEISKQHGDTKRFYCKVIIQNDSFGEGWGSSRKKAEKEAAKTALNNLKTKLSQDLL
ncbi:MULTISPECIES: ribonuclease III [unclassified Prochlorococcus]|nr:MULTISPECIES: ribonuclease III [unclassified Prochlorococcus]KGG14624.1 Ribonuclease III [Prochlorococcus sp. MIT 0602]KGG15948.1 Ribonuclease III [Prochlorococcus sp. MIT 0603]